MKWRSLDMTSTALINNKPKKINLHTPFWANFYMNLKSLKKILIVMCILHVFGLPLLMISTICSSINTENIIYSSMIGFVPLSICCLIGALLCGFIIALNSFDYLYKKSKVDMIYSLPLTIKQRFLSDYLSGLCAYIIPYIISVMIAFIIHGLSYLGLSSWAKTTVSNGITPIMIKASLCGFFIMIMFYTLTVLVTSCCGSMFEAIAYNILINGLIPGVIAVLLLVFFSDLYGIDISDYLLTYISNSSPIGTCIGVVELFDSESNIAVWVKWYLLTFITNVIYFFIAYFLYSKRKAEDVSKPFVFKAFYYITMTAITFIIIALMIYIKSSDSIAPMLFLSAIVYFICEVITNRGFKKFGFSVLRYIGTVCGVVAFCLILKGTNGFGMENNVPSASFVESVTIRYGGIYNDSPDDVTFTDKQSIQTVIEFHKDAIANRFNSYIPEDYYNYDYDNYDIYNKYIDYNDYYNNIKVVYNTRFGSKIYRRYKISFEQLMLLKNLSTSKEYITTVADNFKNSLLNSYLHQYDYVYNGDDNNYFYYDSTSSMKKEIPVEDRQYQIYVNSKIQVNSKDYNNLTYSQIMELSECYDKDLQNRSLDDILTPNDTYCYLNDYIIFSSYENTIKFLTENKLTPPTLQAELQAYNAYDSGYYGDCILYSPNDITCVGGDYYTSINGYRATSGKYLIVNNSLLELLEVAQPNYVTTDRCYILKFNNSMFVIPKEYTDLAENMYSNTNYDYLIKSTCSTLDFDYLDCYLNLHDVWLNNFKSNYKDYLTFIDDVLTSNVDIYSGGNYSGTISANNFNILKNYYDGYWNVYYLSDIQNCWNSWGNQICKNYDDFVWSVLKYSFQNSNENILYDDTPTDTTTSKDSSSTDKQNHKIDDKPIDENLSNI